MARRLSRRRRACHRAGWQDYRRSTPCAAVGAAAAVWVKLAQAQRRGPQEGRLRPGARSCHSTRLALAHARLAGVTRSEEHTSELQALMRISYDVICVQKKKSHPRLSVEVHHN